MHGPHQCDERLVGADVRRRSVSADMLLACRQRECECALAVDIVRQPHYPAGHLPGVILAAGEYAVNRPARGRPDAERLTLPHDDVRAPVPGWLDYPERNGINSDDEGCLVADDSLELH